MGSGSTIPGFEESLMGAAPGAKVIAPVQFPADYHSKGLAGKKADAGDGSGRPYKVGAVDRGEIRVVVEETGVVAPERSIVVKSPISGVVQQLFAREGDRVQSGQVLARIMPDIAQANSLAQLGTLVPNGLLEAGKAANGLIRGGGQPASQNI